MGVALVTGVMLVNGILFILLIELFQALGWWALSAPEGAQDATSELSGRLRLRWAFTS